MFRLGGVHTYRTGIIHYYINKQHCSFFYLGGILLKLYTKLQILKLIT